MNLNIQSRLPLYQQLADKIRTAVDQNIYPANEKIPSENELAKRYGVGRPTVRQATDVLIREGRLQRRRGAGTFVLPPSEYIDLFSLAGTSAAFRQSGVKTDSLLITPVTLLSATQAIEHAQLPVTLKQGPVYFFKRLHQVETVPVLLEVIYLDAELFSGLERFTLEKDSLARIVRDSFSLEATAANQTFSVIQPDVALREMLILDQQQALLHVSRSLHFADYRDRVYCDLYCRTDRFHFSQTITTLANTVAPTKMAG